METKKPLVFKAAIAVSQFPFVCASADWKSLEFRAPSEAPLLPQPDAQTTSRAKVRQREERALRKISGFKLSAEFNDRRRCQGTTRAALSVPSAHL